MLAIVATGLLLRLVMSHRRSGILEIVRTTFHPVEQDGFTCCAFVVSVRLEIFNPLLGARNPIGEQESNLFLLLGFLFVGHQLLMF